MSLASRPFTVLLIVMALAATAATPSAQRGAAQGRGTRPEARAPGTPLGATLFQIAWLAGNWRSTENGAIIEERWITPSGGAMLGLSRTVRGGRMVAFEFMRIVERNGTLVFIAQPNGGAPVEFTLSILTDNSAGFENPAHDFPKVIRYTQRDDGVLQAVVGDGDAKAETFEFMRSPQ